MAKAKESAKAVEAKSGQMTIEVDKQEFIRTRDALITSWVTLEGALRDATRAYISHSNAVIAGNETLDISKLDLTTFLGSQSLQGPPAPPAVEAEEVKPKQKRVTKPKDPNAPKRPLTAYLAWLGDNREKIHSELGSGQGRGGISSEGTKRWHALPTTEHQKYKDKYEEEMDQWRKDMIAYTISIGGTIDPKLLSAQDKDIPDAPEVAAAAGADSSDDSSDSDSDVEEAPEKEPTPPPVKTPRSGKKGAAKKTAAPPSSPPPASSPAKAFTAVNGATSSKRKTAAAAKGETAEEPKKKRSKKETAKEEAAAPASEPKKKKGRKSAGVEA